MLFLLIKKQKKLPYIIFLIKNFNKKMVIPVFFPDTRDFQPLLEIPYPFSVLKKNDGIQIISATRQNSCCAPAL